MDEIKITSNYDERMDKRIVNNPSYKDQLHRVFRSLEEPVKWIVFDDGSFEVIGTTIEEKNKKILSIVRFKNDDGFLNITTIKSSFAKLREFIAGIKDEDEFEEFKSMKAKNAPVINTVESSCGIFTDEGIEIAHMDSLDDYVIEKAASIKDKEEMIAITRGHYPSFSEIPQDMFYSFPFPQDETYSRRSIRFRLLSDLTIVYVDSLKKGKSLKREQYPSSSKNPELVEHNGIPISNKEYYRSAYSTDSSEELNRKIGLAFLHGMKESSRIKNVNPEVYENVRKRTSEHLGIIYVAPGDDPSITSAARAI